MKSTSQQAFSLSSAKQSASNAHATTQVDPLLELLNRIRSLRQQRFKLQRAALTRLYHHMLEQHGEHSPDLPALPQADAKATALFQQLAKRASKVRYHARASHSDFRVGASILCGDGSMVDGVNVECSSYGGTICAERSALVSALSQNKKDLVMIAVCSDSEECISPCGLCRQLLYDYCPDAVVVMLSSRGHSRMSLVRHLLPAAFGADVLPKRTS